MDQHPAWTEIGVQTIGAEAHAEKHLTTRDAYI